MKLKISKEMKQGIKWGAIVGIIWALLAVYITPPFTGLPSLIFNIPVVFGVIFGTIPAILPTVIGCQSAENYRMCIEASGITPETLQQSALIPSIIVGALIGIVVALVYVKFVKYFKKKR